MMVVTYFFVFCSIWWFSMASDTNFTSGHMADRAVPLSAWNLYLAYGAIFVLRESGHLLRGSAGIRSHTPVQYEMACQPGKAYLPHLYAQRCA